MRGGKFNHNATESGHERREENVITSMSQVYCWALLHMISYQPRNSCRHYNHWLLLLFSLRGERVNHFPRQTQLERSGDLNLIPAFPDVPCSLCWGRGRTAVPLS